MCLTLMADMSSRVSNHEATDRIRQFRQTLENTIGALGVVARSQHREGARHHRDWLAIGGA